MAVTMKNAVFVVDTMFLSSGLHLPVTANVPSSVILSTLMEAIHFSKTSVLTRATQCHIPEESILQPNVYSSKGCQHEQSLDCCI
jgi:hypothetical protein